MIKNIGPLERKILNILWDKKEASTREICNTLGECGDRKACSTVRTIINRLVVKKIISQKMNNQKRIYIYRPLFNKNELEKKIVHGLITEMLRRFEKSTISYLAEELSDNEEDIEKIKQKLEELKKDV
jgi:predicted transcriptional regulator